VAGVIKMVMAMRHELLPRTLHVDAPTSQVDWLTEEVPWKRNGRPRRAGVSSFGISGTNAHVIIEEHSPAEPKSVAPDTSVLAGLAPEDPSALGEPENPSAPLEGIAPENPSAPLEGIAPDPSVAPEFTAPRDSELAGLPMTVWTVSGKGPGALRAQADRLHRFVRAEEDLAGNEVGLALARRAALENRAVVIGSARAELLDGLAMLAEGQAAPNVFQGIAAGSAGGVAFMFTGQGAQRAGMGSELYRAFPIFKDALDEVSSKLAPQLECSPLEAMFAAPDTPSARLLDETMFTQAGLFALEVALLRLLESWGVKPDYLIGHSIGELTAAFAAGIFSLEDACKLVAARGRLMGELETGGAMIAVQAGPEEALESLTESAGRVALAAVNGASSVVLSGDEDAVMALAQTWRLRERKVKRLRVSHAFHSPRMDGMLEAFAEVAREVSFAPPDVPVVSNLTGEVEGERLCSPEYWVNQVRDTVRFADGIGWLEGQGVSSFLEVGPDGVLSAMVGDCLSEDSHASRGEGWAAMPLLTAGRPEVLSLGGALAELWTRGGAVDWQAMLAQPNARRVRLPTYAFQRTRHWMEGKSEAAIDDSQLGERGDGGFLEAIEHEDLDGLLSILGIEDADRRASLDALLPSLGAWRQRNRQQSMVDGWRYRVQWKPAAIASVPLAPVCGLVIVPSARAEDEWIAEMLGGLERRGMQTLRVELEPTDDLRGHLVGRLREALDELSGERKLEGVLSLLALDEAYDPLRTSVPRGLAATVALAQAASDVQLSAPLWMITRGAVSVGPSDRLVSPLQAQVWGLGLAVGLENPQRLGGVIDLPQQLDERTTGLLSDVLACAGTEDQLAVRQAGVFARRLVHASAGEMPDSRSLPTEGTVLITGATGGLGGHVARWLAHHGAKRLLLVSRRGADSPAATQLQSELSRLDVEVEFAACDVADRDRLASVIESLPDDSPLSAVFHAAGTSVHGPIDSLSIEDLEQALSAKAQGALHLDALTQHLKLSAFVLFSSIAGTLGSAQQGAYAAANACLDALATQRSARGLPATSIAWGPWAGAGMASAGDGQAAEALRRRGLDCLAPGLAVKALEGILIRGETIVTVADIRWETYAPIFTLARSRPLIEDLPETRVLSHGELGAGDESVAGELRRRLQGMPIEEHGELLIKLVQTEVARVLGHSSVETVEMGRAFKDLGFDSLLAVELRNRLSAASGLDLPATLVFDYPTPAAVVEHLTGELTGEAGGISVEDELTQIERRLLSLGDSRDVTAARSRLSALIARLDGLRGPIVEQADLAQRIQSASDEEIFGLIDRELG
jgi:acyl transferase domain-containing protein/acyl carrier protein